MYIFILRSRNYKQKRCFMENMISYKNLWKKLIDIEMTKTEFQKKIKISTSTLAKLSRDEYVSMDVLVRICAFFNCQLSEICELIYDKEVVIDDIK